MINIIGQILDSSGYSIHTRNLLNALMKYTDVKLTSVIPQGAELSLTDKELAAFKRTGIADINLIITHPMYWRMHSTAKVNIAYLVWEGDKIPYSFIKECMNPEINFIIVPSKHTKHAVINTLAEMRAQDKIEIDDLLIVNKIKVIPHGVNLDLFYPTEKPTDKFVFIANKGYRNLEDRGGIQYLIKAYLEEFSSKDNVELLIKINPAYGVPDMNSVIQSFIGDRTDFPYIRVVIENLPYSEMVKLYNRGHVFVSPTRAEAFNIPCLEAMACGLPVITTNFGGQTDYVNDSNGWLIGGELTEVKHEVQYEGIKWLTPSLSELREALRAAYSSKNTVDDKSKAARATAQNLTWDNPAKHIIKLI